MEQTDEKGNPLTYWGGLEEPKQENLTCKDHFIVGTKCQQERSYSEEEVYHILCEHTAFLFAGGKSTLTDWFEQFKK